MAASPLVIRQENSITNSSVNGFADIAPTKDIQWQPCYGGEFLCLTLEVPLHYDDPTLGSTNVTFLKHETQCPNCSWRHDTQSWWTWRQWC